MKKSLAIVALLALGACSDKVGGTDGGGGGGGGTNGVPEELARNLNSADYDAKKKTLEVNMDNLASSPIDVKFTRAKNLDVAGYEAYMWQEVDTQRRFVGLFRQSGGVIAGNVVDGGQFEEYLAGGTYKRTGEYSQPKDGLITYEGTYAGMLNIQQGGSFIDAGTPLRTQGKVRINADFTKMSVNGGIFDRQIVGGEDLRNVAMSITPINKGGTFEGKLTSDLTGVGTYGGIFGGKNANDVAAVLVFEPKGADGSSLTTGNGKVQEHGAIAVHCVKKPKGVKCD